MSNVDVVRNELLRLGWSPVQVNGLVGRFQQESGPKLNTTIRGDGGMSHGIAQWNRDRLSGLHNFAKSQGGDWSDPVIQARYVNHELNSSESAAGKMLRGATTLEDAARAAMSYERPAGWKRDNPTAGHGWGNTLANAQRLAGVQVNPNAVVASAPIAPATPSTGLTLNTAAVPSVSAPAAPVAAAPEKSIFDTFKSDGMKAGIGALAKNNSVTGALSGLAGVLGGGQQQQAADSSAYDIQPSSIGADQQQAALAQGAQQMMANLLNKKRGNFGLSLSG